VAWPQSGTSTVGVNHLIRLQRKIKQANVFPARVSGKVVARLGEFADFAEPMLMIV
jgi:hypothetical protein